MNTPSTPTPPDDSDCPFLRDADTAPVEELMRRAQMLRELTEYVIAAKAKRKAALAARRLANREKIIRFPLQLR